MAFYVAWEARTARSIRRDVDNDGKNEKWGRGAGAGEKEDLPAVRTVDLTQLTTRKLEILCASGQRSHLGRAL